MKARTSALALAFAASLASEGPAQDEPLESNAALGWSELHAALDVEQRERGLRRLILGGAPGRRELERAARSSDADVQRLAMRGLGWLEPARASELWLAASASRARKTRREAAVRLAHDATAEGEAALRSLASDAFDDVSARACFAWLARGKAGASAEVPPPGASVMLRRAWVEALPWSATDGLQHIRASGDPALQVEFFRRLVRDGLPRCRDLDLLAGAIGEAGAALYDRRAALAILGPSSAAGIDVDLFAANFESEEGADALETEDRALLLRCLHAGAAVPRATERFLGATRDRVAWLMPAWPWILDRAQRQSVLERSLHGAIAEELAQLLQSDPDLAAFPAGAYLDLYRQSARSAVRQALVRAAARSPLHFRRMLDAALTDPEALVRELAVQLAIEQGRIDTAIGAAQREVSPLVQVHLATALGAAFERRGERERAAQLADTWARSEEPKSRRLALHLLLSIEPTDSALAAARELWAHMPADDGERSDAHGLLARFERARAETIEGLRELGEDDVRSARERVAHLAPSAIADRFEGEEGFSLPVRGELAWRRTLEGDVASAAFLREHFDRLPEELALRALDALATAPDAASWQLFLRLEREGRYDRDVLLESAAPMIELPEVADALRRALGNAGEPQMRQAALRGLGRAGPRGQEWLTRAIQVEHLAPGAFSSGDLIAWIEALDHSAANASLVARSLVARSSAGWLLAELRLRPELARALQWLASSGGTADRALLAELQAACSSGSWAAVATPALTTLIAATAEELPASALFLARWADATAEPDAELAYRAEPVLARAASEARDLEALRRHLGLWLAAWNELEIRGLLPARDLAPLELLGAAQPSLQARVLLHLLDVERALAAGDASAARDRFACALAAAFFDAGARALACAYGARSAELSADVRAEEARWQKLGAPPAKAELCRPFIGIESLFHSLR